MSTDELYDEDLEDQEFEDEDTDEEDEDDNSSDDDSGSDDQEAGSSKEETVEEKRERRREERRIRKERQKAAQAAADRELKNLRRENSDLRKRVERIEGANESSYEQKVESAIVEAEKILEEADIELQRAVKRSDGAGVSEALKLRDEAREKLGQFKAAKVHLQKSKNAPKQGLNETLARNHQIFRSRFPDYNPKGNDDFSKRVEEIDQELFDEGQFHPADGRYWAELEKRVRAISSKKQETKPRSRTSPTSGSGKRSTTGKKGFTLSQERRKAMKDAGYVEGSKDWNELVADYKRIDKENR